VFIIIKFEMQRLLALVGHKASPFVNYCTLSPKDKELAKRLKEERSSTLNNLALPSVIFSIILLIVVLPLTLTESLSMKYKMYIMVRFATLCLTATLWYFLRNKIQNFVHMYALIVYVSFAIFSFIFPDLELGFDEIRLAVEEFNTNNLAFMAYSLFLA